MATLDLWLEGDWGEENNIVWHQAEIPFDLQRFHYDQRYAYLVDEHVKHAIEYLGKELAEIAMIEPPATENDWTHCE